MIPFEKIIDYIGEELPFVTHTHSKFLTLDHVYRQYYTIFPYKHDTTMSDNLVIMSYIRPICNNFKDNRRLPDRDYLCCVQKTAYDPLGISLCFEPIELSTSEIIEGWIATKFRESIVNTGFNDDSIVISTEISIPDRIGSDTDFMLTGFIEPIMEALLTRIHPDLYLIRCTFVKYDSLTSARVFLLELTKETT